jgi:Tol biopolymer transport system component
MLARVLVATLVVIGAVAALLLANRQPDAPAGRVLPSTTAGTATATATPAAPDRPEPLPPLIFARGGQLWHSDGTANAPQQLTTFPVDEVASQPALSPDGAQIAFVTLTQPPITATIALPTARLDLLDRASGVVTTLWQPQRGILWLPSWAGDGSAVYVFANGTSQQPATSDAERLQIVRVERATRERTTLVRNAMDPSVSPDGRQIAYLVFGDNGISMHLMVADIGGGNARRVLDGSRFQGFFAPRWSPDGQRIVLAGLNGPPTDSQGFPVEARAPSPWEWLAQAITPVAEAHGAPWDVWIVNMDGGGLRNLAPIQDDMPMAAFSPDGSQIVIMAYQGFYRIGGEGRDLRRIATPGDHGGIVWDTQAAR